MEPNQLQLPSSYRDNDGFVFKHAGEVYRYIHPGYFEHYNHLMDSGLYKELSSKGWLVAHTETGQDSSQLFPHLPQGKIIRPTQIPFISYPYEWSFAMWQDAALLTLKVTKKALEKEMLLKDATPFNIQFIKGRPVFIDTLSFEKYKEGGPWVAYRQFCESFLSILLLMHYNHPDTNKLFTVYPNGVPLDLLATLLPFKARLSFNNTMHIFLQAKIKGGGDNKNAATQKKLPKQKLILLLDNLIGHIKKLRQKNTKLIWDDYYTNTILNNEYLQAKAGMVKSFVSAVEFNTMIDMGANDGYFSCLFKDTGKQIISIDGDANCINELYNKIRKEKIKTILPLINNIASPSPAIGWANAERSSINERLKADVVMALALIHHLAIGCNLPLSFVADWLSKIAPNLIIEFVPKSDEKVKMLLQNREDIFNEYTIEGFKAVFGRLYNIIKEERVGNTGRVLFLMQLK